MAPIEEAYDNQRRFVQDSSHELKTPVAAIKTNLELLTSHPDESVASQMEWLGNIEAETAHMQHLTTRLLTLVRADSDVPSRERKRFSLSDTVQSCILPMEAVMFEKNLQFSSSVAEEVTMLGDREDVRRLVHILLENAIQYTPVGGAVKLQLRADRRKANLRVENTGAGIAPRDLPHIFERFYRGDDARQRETNNYGLGLSIAQAIVQQHKGQIQAVSTLGESTTFTVVLPTA